MNTRMNELLTNIMELPKYEECMEYKELYNQLEEGEPIKKYYEDQLNILVNPALERLGFTDDGLAIVALPPAPPTAANFDFFKQFQFLPSAPPDPSSHEWLEMRGVLPAQYATAATAASAASAESAAVGKCNNKNKYFCTHGRRRTYCKDCGGTSICEHDKRRSDCKDCGGSSFCQHGKQKSRCKECGGVGICIHGREKRFCKECGGGGICEHGKSKYNCKDCGGAGICIHGRDKRYCKVCGGPYICTHGRIKRYCKVCNPSQGGSKTIKSKKSYRNVKMSFRKNKKVVAHKKTKRLKSSSASSRKSHVYI